MITLYSGLVVKQPLVETVIPAFEESRGVRIETTFEPTSVLLARIEDGERPDLLLGVSQSLHALAIRGILDPTALMDIAVSSVGFARPAGTPGPADGSATAFLQYLTAARSVAYTLSGASGKHFMTVMGERRLLDAIDERAERFTSGLTAQAVADGRCDIAIQQVSELRSVPGDHIIAELPAELQSYGRFAIGARSAAPNPAVEFVSYLRGELAQQAFADVGLTPA
ncbi:MAG: molybdate ABC transporter substrate-binding protein [Beutenbergiaceae bacterium]